MSHIIKTAIKWLAITIYAIAVFVVLVKELDILHFLILGFLPLYIIFFLTREKKELDELEKTIFLKASRNTFFILAYFGGISYLFLISLIGSRGELAIDHDHLHTGFMGVYATGSFVYASALFVQYIYYQSERLLNRMSILRSAQATLVSLIVLATASIFHLTIIALNISEPYPFEFFLYLIMIIAVNLAYGKKYPVEKFSLREREIYTHTKWVGLTAGLICSLAAFWVDVSLHREAVSLFFKALNPILIGSWVGIFVHSASSLVLFLFLKPETQGAVIKSSGEDSDE